MVESFLAESGATKEIRRLGRPPLRAEGTGGQSVELGPHECKREFELLFRLYGPEKAVFDKTWKLPDVEQLAAAQAEVPA
jgi:hypothetical protein